MVEVTANRQNLSVGKLFTIVETMVENKAPMRIQEIAHQTGMNISTVTRFLNALIAIHYAARDPETSRYYLTLKFSYIGSLVMSKFSFLKDCARPYLRRIVELCRESASLAIEHEMMAVYVEVAEGPDHLLQTLRQIGHRAPLHCTGVGKVLLSGFSQERLDNYIKERGLFSSTEKTITSKEVLLRELASVRKTGYGWDDEECEVGVKCLAAAIHDESNGIVAAISVSAPTSRFDRLDKNELAGTLVKFSEEIALSIGAKSK